MTKSAKDLGAQRKRAALRALCSASLMRGEPTCVNLQIPKHHITGPVLRDLAYDPEYVGKHLSVVFTDGSRSVPFPTGRQAGGQELVAETKEALLLRAPSVLKLGVMSMRHPELDYLVDLYITRNTELSRKDDTFAEREALSFDRTVRILSDPLLEQGGEVWAYHSGYEPMIVGFYRAIDEVLVRRRALGYPQLVIRPWLLVAFESKRSPKQHGMTNLRAGRRGAKSTRLVDEERVARKHHKKHYTVDSPGAKVVEYDPMPAWY